VSFWPDYNVTDDRMKVEWIVRAKAGVTINITARHERAGTIRAQVTLRETSRETSRADDRRAT